MQAGASQASPHAVPQSHHSQPSSPPSPSSPPVSPPEDEESGGLTDRHGLLKEDAPAAAPVWSSPRFTHVLVAVAIGATVLAALRSLGGPGSDATSSSHSRGHEHHGLSASAVLARAARRALGGGLGGAVAGVTQVLTLMWLRTTMNYQYRYGGGTRHALATLYAQGGVARFYQGLPWALLQTPLSRFGDTAANTGMLALLGALELGLPLGVRTAAASMAAAAWRILITPLDTLKTTLQVEGPSAYHLLLRKARRDGMRVLWSGALANAAANFVGGYPWFLTFNMLDEALPAPPPGAMRSLVVRSALMGVVATTVSDCLSNSLRVLKTTRQTATASLSYADVARQIIVTDGVAGLLGRGLPTRLCANVLQSVLFTVVWKLVEARVSSR